jgi:hypothetical protein
MCVIFNKANDGHRVQVSQVIFEDTSRITKEGIFNKRYIQCILRRYIMFSREDMLRGILRRDIQPDNSTPNMDYYFNKVPTPEHFEYI